MTMKGTTVAVQGFGNVGSVAARAAAARRLQDRRDQRSHRRLPQPRGSTSTRRSSTCASTSRSRASRGGDQITNEDLLTLDVDVLLPAALENVITSKNAGKIRAKIICEGANGPTTARRRLDPRREGHLRHSRHPRERGRRDRLVLRVGAGSRRLLLDGRDGERAAHATSCVDSFARRARAVEAAQGEHAHGGVHAVDQPRRDRAPAARASTRERPGPGAGR